MTLYYVDGTRADDTGAGTSEATAKKTIAAGYALLAAGDTLYIKASVTYGETISLTATVGTDAAPITIQGYTTTIGDGGRATVSGANTRASCLVINKNFQVIRNMIFTDALTRCVDFTATLSAIRLENCQFLKGSGSGLVGMDSSTFNGVSPFVLRCLLSGFTTNAVARFAGYLIACQVSGCGPVASGTFNSNLVVSNCLISGGAGPGIDIASNNAFIIAENNTVTGKTSGSGIRVGSTTSGFIRITNNLLTGNAAYGLDGPASNYLIADYNAYYNNTSGARNTITAGAHDVTLSADPFTSSGTGDYSPNSTAGAGALVRAAGLPGAFPGGVTTGYTDIGAVQHQDGGGTSSGGKKRTPQ